MATALNRDAADDGASNLWLCSGGSLRVTLVVHRRRAGQRQRKCEHNGRNNVYNCFHRDPLGISAKQCRQRRCLPFVRRCDWIMTVLGGSPLAHHWQR